LENNENFWRSGGAILAGFLTGAVLSLGADEMLHALNVFPPWGQPMDDHLFWMPALYRFIFNAAGCYLAARLAPNKPLRHALVIGALGFFLGLAGTLAAWNHVPSLGPHWYSAAVVLMSLPCAWLGGSLAVKKAD
jgi:hypothetical protein